MVPGGSSPEPTARLTPEEVEEARTRRSMRTWAALVLSSRATRAPRLYWLVVKWHRSTATKRTPSRLQKKMCWLSAMSPTISKLTSWSCSGGGGVGVMKGSSMIQKGVSGAFWLVTVDAPDRAVLLVPVSKPETCKSPSWRRKEVPSLEAESLLVEGTAQINAEYQGGGISFDRTALEPGRGTPGQGFPGGHIPTVTVTALGAAVVRVVVAKQQLSRTEAREAMACL